MRRMFFIVTGVVMLCIATAGCIITSTPNYGAYPVNKGENNESYFKEFANRMPIYIETHPEKFGITDPNHVPMGFSRGSYIFLDGDKVGHTYLGETSYSEPVLSQITVELVLGLSLETYYQPTHEILERLRDTGLLGLYNDVRKEYGLDPIDENVIAKSFNAESKGGSSGFGNGVYYSTNNGIDWDSIQHGDILLVGQENFSSGLAGNYGHAGIVDTAYLDLNDPDGSECIWSATLHSNGVENWKYTARYSGGIAKSGVYREYGGKYNSEWVCTVVRLKDRSKVDRIIEYARAQEGKPYILSLNLEDEDEFYCSKLVYKAIASTGIKVKNNGLYFLPDDFIKDSANFEIIRSSAQGAGSLKLFMEPLENVVYASSLIAHKLNASDKNDTFYYPEYKSFVLTGETIICDAMTIKSNSNVHFIAEKAIVFRPGFTIEKGAAYRFYLRETDIYYELSN